MDPLWWTLNLWPDLFETPKLTVASNFEFVWSPAILIVLRYEAFQDLLVPAAIAKSSSKHFTDTASPLQRRWFKPRAQYNLTDFFFTGNSKSNIIKSIYP